MTAKSHLNVVFGAMTFGLAGTEGARTHDLDSIGAILDVFQAHGHSEVDTARVYTSGTSEQLLGELRWKQRGLNVETKLYPSGNIRHTPEGIREHLQKSLDALKTDNIELFYLHAPDRSTPWEITFKAIDELHKEGKFAKLGLSNYRSWEVAEIVTLCKINGWIQPTVYQGIYNAIHRAVEPDLFPVLRKYGISFYAYNPLGGSFLTGRYKDETSAVDTGARFDVSRGTMQAVRYRERYWNDSNFKAINIIQDAASKEGLTMPEVALRWISHHSQMKRESGDAVIIGASSLNHIDQNLTDLEKGPLPESVIDAIDKAWFPWLDRSYLVDWLVSFVWYGIARIFAHNKPFERDFSAHDTVISHEMRSSERVTGFVLHITSFGVPIAVVILFALVHRSAIEIHHSVLAIWSSKCLQDMIVNILKNRVGRLRPDFLSRCQWDGNNCTGTEHLVTEGRRSFPSGHSSASWVGMTFLFLYFCTKTSVLRKRQVFPSRSFFSSALARLTIALAPLAFSTWVAITRLEDYRHHKEDVIVGGLIGFGAAWVIFHFYFPSPFEERRPKEVLQPRELYAEETESPGFVALEQFVEEDEERQRLHTERRNSQSV